MELGSLENRVSKTKGPVVSLWKAGCCDCCLVSLARSSVSFGECSPCSRFGSEGPALGGSPDMGSRIWHTSSKTAGSNHTAEAGILSDSTT